MIKIFHWKPLLASFFCLFVSLKVVQAQQVLIKESNIVRQAENTTPTNNWVGYFREGTPQSALQFMNGPGVPSHGCGSVQLTTVTGSEKVTLFNYDHVGKSLGAINEISYATNRSVALNPAQVASMNLQIDFNGPASGGFSTLVFEPIYNPAQGPIINGTWQNWDGKSGIWWSTRPINSQPAGAALVDMRTWSQIVANNPAATILGAVGINQGSGNGGLTTAVDDFRFDVNIYNFEFQNNAVINTNTGRTYCTIQSAINDPLTAPGNIINVGAGTYNGNVTISKAITLRGANAGVSGCNSRGIESTILNGAFTIASNGVTIDGFEFTGTGARIASSGSLTTESNIAIVNNYIHATNAQQAILHGFGTGGGIGTTNWTVSSNKIEDIQVNNATAIALFNITNAVVNNNCISHTNPSSLGRRGINADGLQSATINGNTIDMGLVNPLNAAAFGSARYQLQLSSSNQSSNNITVNGNIFKGAFDGIVTLGNGNYTTVTISNNEISNVVFGIRTQAGTNTPPGSLANFFIQNNSISSSNRSIFLQDGAPTPDPYTNITINNNSLLRSTLGIALDVQATSNITDGPVNATCNWYGSTSNAVIATKISGPVTYIPYLTNGTDNAAATGFQPVDGSCNGSNVLTITCPANLIVQCTSQVPAVNVGSVIISGTCPGTVTHISDVISNQTCANRYILTRTYQATDVCGNMATCTQTITVNDNTLPTITCPPNQTVAPATLTGTVVTYPTPAVSDNCTGVGAAVRTAGPASGSIFPIGTTTVTYQLTDACGLTAICSFTVTVLDPYCDDKKKKAYVCHNGNAICVSVNAVQAHLDHGDYLGQCTTSLRAIVIEHPVTDEFSVSVFPNPSADNFRVMATGKSNELFTVKIMDNFGRVLSVNARVSKDAAITLGKELNPGIYYAEVTQGSERKMVKLIKL